MMKYLNEAHKINSESAMKHLSERKLPLDLEKVQAQVLRSSTDRKKKILKNA